METTPIRDLLDLIRDYGLIAVLGGGLIVYIAMNFQKIWNRLALAFGGSVRAMLHEERIKQLESDLAKERIDCDRKMSEMRRAYEAKLASLEKRIDEMNEHFIQQAQDIATLKERLSNHVGTKSRGKAA